jgi:hypothetical protein
MVLNKENLGAQIEINWWWSTVLLPVQMKSADQLAQKSQLVNLEFCQFNAQMPNCSPKWQGGTGEDHIVQIVGHVLDIINEVMKLLDCAINCKQRQH